MNSPKKEMMNKVYNSEGKQETLIFQFPLKRYIWQKVLIIKYRTHQRLTCPDTHEDVEQKVQWSKMAFLLQTVTS